MFSNCLGVRSGYERLHNHVKILHLVRKTFGNIQIHNHLFYYTYRLYYHFLVDSVFHFIVPWLSDWFFAKFELHGKALKDASILCLEALNPASVTYLLVPITAIKMPQLKLLHACSPVTVTQQRLTSSESCWIILCITQKKQTPN
jgi:hypothetical protein